MTGDGATGDGSTGDGSIGPAGSGTGGQPLVSCAVCGTSGQGPPPTWSSQTSARGLTWLCGRCTRDNLCSIEGRLDEAWW